MVRKYKTCSLPSYQNFIIKNIKKQKNELTMNKIQKFANIAGTQPSFTSPTTPTYAGEAAAGYIAAALLSANTLDKKLVTIMPNVKYRSVIQKLSLSNLIQDASCDFTTVASASLSERYITPEEFQVNLQICKQTFVQSWQAMQLGFSAFDEIPKDFNDFLISYVGGNVAQAIEQSIWNGNASTNGEFDGFQTLLSASVAVAGATDVLPARLTGGSSSIISGSITSANVLSKLQSMVDTIPNAVYGKQDLVIYVGTGIAKAYQLATAGLTGATSLANQTVANIGANGYQNAFTIGEKPYNFNGIDLVLCPGMSDNKIVGAQKSNLFFGTGLMSDQNEVKVIDMANIDGSQNYRVIMRYTAAVNFGIGQDIVYYGAY